MDKTRKDWEEWAKEDGMVVNHTLTKEEFLLLLKIAGGLFYRCLRELIEKDEFSYMANKAASKAKELFKHHPNQNHWLTTGYNLDEYSFVKYSNKGRPFFVMCNNDEYHCTCYIYSAMNRYIKRIKENFNIVKRFYTYDMFYVDKIVTNKISDEELLKEIEKERNRTGRPIYNILKNKLYQDVYNLRRPKEEKILFLEEYQGNLWDIEDLFSPEEEDILQRI